MIKDLNEPEDQAYQELLDLPWEEIVTELNQYYQEQFLPEMDGSDDLKEALSQTGITFIAFAQERITAKGLWQEITGTLTRLLQRDLKEKYGIDPQLAKWAQVAEVSNMSVLSGKQQTTGNKLCWKWKTVTYQCDLLSAASYQAKKYVLCPCGE